MKFFSCILTFLLFTFFLEGTELLERDDIHTLMEQIFKQHVSHDRMTKEIIRSSYRAYLLKFDPEKIYLLADEVTPYIQPTDEQLSRDLEDYKQGRFKTFEELNELVIRAIIRAEGWREELYEEPDSLFSEAVEHRSLREWGENQNRGYAQSDTILKKRQKGDLLAFIEEQKARYGERQVNVKKERVLRLYEWEMEAHEEGYLDTDLGDVEKEHRFTLHVLKALAHSLDSHTKFFNEAEAYDIRVRLQKGYEGTGILFEEGLEGPIVSKIISPSSASRDGKVKLKDLLVEIDGKKVDEISFSEAMDLLRGPRGSYVRLTFRSEGKTYSVELHRERLTVVEGRVNTQFETFGDGVIGIISLHSFYQNEDGISAEKDVRDAIEYLRRQGPIRGLVLDLRRNSGGYLSQAVKVAGLFITNGVVLISKYNNGEEKYYRDLDGRVYYSGPLVVLTSKKTASAAEIVAQALQDYGVGLVVGDEATYGKGSIQSQTVTDSDATSYFKVTVGKYYTVSGKTPQVRGVEADIIVPSYAYYKGVGEQYLESHLDNDQIASAYDDPLEDIHPYAKGWFLKYYLPTLQGKKKGWKELVPQLRKNSQYRMTHNRDYKEFFESQAKSESPKFTNYDVQALEAINIVKDMFLLQSDLNENFTGVPKRLR